MMRTLRLLFWSLVAGAAGAGVFTGIGQLFSIVGGRCNAVCRPSVSIPAGFFGGLMVIAMLEHDRRARLRSDEAHRPPSE